MTRTATHSLVYVSSAVKPLTREELRHLLGKSRANNVRNGITGMLLYKDGNFMQVLEGERGAVEATHERIVRDRRHHNMIVLLRRDQDERHFADFSMGFHDLNSPEVRALPGYSEFLNTPLTGEEFSGDPNRSWKLLLSFKKGTGPRL